MQRRECWGLEVTRPVLSRLGMWCRFGACVVCGLPAIEASRRLTDGPLIPSQPAGAPLMPLFCLEPLAAAMSFTRFATSGQPCYCLWEMWQTPCDEVI